jgi:hypothetical protein
LNFTIHPLPPHPFIPSNLALLRIRINYHLIAKSDKCHLLVGYLQLSLSFNPDFHIRTLLGFEEFNFAALPGCREASAGITHTFVHLLLVIEQSITANFRTGFGTAVEICSDVGLILLFLASCWITLVD